MIYREIRAREGLVILSRFLALVPRLYCRYHNNCYVSRLLFRAPCKAPYMEIHNEIQVVSIIVVTLLFVKANKYDFLKKTPL